MRDIFKIIEIPKSRNLYFLFIFFLIEGITNWVAYYIFGCLSLGFADIEKYQQQRLGIYFCVIGSDSTNFGDTTGPSSSFRAATQAEDFGFDECLDCCYYFGLISFL